LIDLFANSLELARAEESADLEDPVRAVAAKFTGVYQVRAVTAGFMVGCLMFVALIGDENRKAHNLPRLEENLNCSHTEDQGLAAQFAMLRLAMPCIFCLGSAVASHYVFERLVGWLDQPNVDKTHLVWLVLTLIQLSRNSTAFVRFGSFMPAVIAFLKGLSHDDPVVHQLTSCTLQALYCQSMPLAQCVSFDNGFARRQRFAMNGLVVTFC